MSEKHKAPSLFDLDELGFGDDEKDEPDTNATIQIIVEDSKTPGIGRSLLALMGYTRKSHRHLHKRIDALEVKDGRRVAYIAGAVAASTVILGAAVWMIHTFAPPSPQHVQPAPTVDPAAVAREIVKQQAQQK